MKSILSAVIGATLALSAIEADAQATPGERQVSLTIETDTLASALDKWAQQSGFQIFVQDWEATKKLPARSLKGTFTAQDALEQLLSGTSLTYTWISDKAVSIRKKTQQTVPTALQRTSLEGQQGIPVAKFSGDDAGQPQFVTADSGGGSASEFGNVEEGPHNTGEIEEVLVTGTYIRGTAPVGSPVLVIDREAIKASGRARVEDLFEALPQNFSGSVSEDHTADFRSHNETRGTTIDLRGLGAGTTLILVNGRRQPAGGLEGTFTDISSIPAAAIERIEVLTDGASALYGSDAIGGVVNFILRKDYDGLDATARFGTIGGSAQEVQASIINGIKWDSGSVLLGYQYSDRERLHAADSFYGSKGLDYRSLGGTDFREPYANPGTIFDPVTFLPAFAIPHGQDGRSLTVDQLIPGQNYQDTVNGFDALPEQKLHSAFVTASQRVSERIEVFAEARYGQRDMAQSFGNSAIFVVPDTNPFYVDPFNAGLVVVGYDPREELGLATFVGETDTYSLAAGVTASIADQWRLDAAFSRGKEDNSWEFRNVLNFFTVDAALADPDPATALNVFGDHPQNNPATIDSIRATELGRGVSTVDSVTAILEGPVVHLPAGDLRLAIGADYRDESLKATRTFTGPAMDPFPIPSAVGDLDRDVTAVFAELAIPLLGGDVSAEPRVEVSLAGRYEEYSDFGSAWDPKVGISIQPVSNLRIRGSWGESFRAPAFNQLSPTANPSVSNAFTVVDPRSPSGFTQAIFLNGGNPDIEPETARTWTAGLDLTFDSLPGLSLSSTYFSIDYDNKIRAGGDGADTLVLEDRWVEIITRNPTPEQIQAACNSPGFSGACPQGDVVIIDQRLRNLGGVRARGIDFDFAYNSPLPLGKITIGLGGTRLLTFDQAVSETSPHIDVLDTVGNPLALRARLRAGWSTDQWNINAFVNYSGAYADPATNRDVGAWTTLDASIAYVFDGAGSIGGTTLQLSVINALDKEAPFVDQYFGFDMANASDSGRSLSLTVTKTW
jgi:iron complex outermembrane receptor protein